jgi:DNA ligase-1
VLEGGEIRIYSRNSEDNTSKYPDIIRRFPSVLGEGVKSCVIDAEAVAWDKEKNQILPFQVLSTRKRKVGCLCLRVEVCKKKKSKIGKRQQKKERKKKQKPMRPKVYY